ncbi:MAG: S8 family serine peptidase [Acidimicrobiales bacterium]
MNSAYEAGNVPDWPAWAFDGADGARVRVAVVDSGVDADHPGLDDAVDTSAGLWVTRDETNRVVVRTGTHRDAFGQGTACAGVVHGMAPKAAIVSVRVVDGVGELTDGALMVGLARAIAEGFDVILLSVATVRRCAWPVALDKLCLRALLSGSFIVTAFDGFAPRIRDGLFGPTTSAGCNISTDARQLHYDPALGADFLARGVDIDVLWRDGRVVRATGNAYAAAHLAGLAALAKSKHPDLRPFQLKTVLWGAARNARSAPDMFGGRSASIVSGWAR